MKKDNKYIEIMELLNYKTIGGVLLRLFGISLFGNRKRKT